MIKRAWNFLKKWGWLIGSIVIALVGFIVGGVFVRELRKPHEKIKRELDVMKAGTNAAAHAVEANAETALREIERAEEETIASLNETRRAKYEALRRAGDPERVMRHLERYADPRRRKRYTGNR